MEGIDIIDLIKSDEKIMNIFVKKYYNSLSNTEKKFGKLGKTLFRKKL